MENESKKNKSGVGFALWVLAALLLLVIFLVNQKRIATNLNKTKFFERVSGKNPSFVENVGIPEQDNVDRNEVAPVESSQSFEIDLNSLQKSQKAGIIAQNDAAKNLSTLNFEEKHKDFNENFAFLEDDEQFFENQEIATNQNMGIPENYEKKDSAVAVDVKPQMMKIKLYFMTISPSGVVGRCEVVREMEKSTTPLMDAVNALIEGPDFNEERSGCRSLVSSGTHLLGASVRDGIATLNFSSEFEFNQYGIEGTRGQLQQIVYTATAFPTVEEVQFLVDGENKEYLGSEGVWIGTPLNRMSF